MNKDQIAEAFENLLEHLEVEIKKLSEEVKKASESQDYKRVQQTARKAEQITVLCDKVRSLYQSRVTMRVGRQGDPLGTFSSGTQGIRTMSIENSEINFRHAYEILLNTAEWLIKKGN